MDKDGKEMIEQRLCKHVVVHCKVVNGEGRKIDSYQKKFNLATPMNTSK